MYGAKTCFSLRGLHEWLRNDAEDFETVAVKQLKDASSSAKSTLIHPKKLLWSAVPRLRPRAPSSADYPHGKDHMSGLELLKFVEVCLLFMDIVGDPRQKERLYEAHVKLLDWDRELEVAEKGIRRCAKYNTQHRPDSYRPSEPADPEKVGYDLVNGESSQTSRWICTGTNEANEDLDKDLVVPFWFDQGPRPFGDFELAAGRR